MVTQYVYHSGCKCMVAEGEVDVLFPTRRVCIHTDVSFQGIAVETTPGDFDSHSESLEALFGPTPGCICFKCKCYELNLMHFDSNIGGVAVNDPN